MLPYPRPPPDTRNLVSGGGTAAISLGSIIPNINLRDEPINQNNILPFPREMRVSLAQKKEFGFTDISFGAKFGLSILGVEVAGLAGSDAAFKAPYRNEIALELVETYHVRPTPGYIARCLEFPPIAHYIKATASKIFSTWSVYMVTGLAIGRRGERSRKPVSASVTK